VRTQPASREGVHPSDDTLFDLAHDLLGGSAESVLVHVRACAACETRLRAFGRDRELLRGVPPGSDWRAASGTRPAPRILPFPSVSRWTVPVAAAAALAMIVLVPALRQNHARPVESPWLPVATSGTLLRNSPGDASRADLQRALEIYSTGEPGPALEALQNLVLPPGAEYENSIRALYLASALVLNARPVDAVAVLDALETATLPEPWRRWAQWTRYVAVRDAGRGNEAADLLNTLAGLDNDVGERARAERRRLEAAPAH